MNKTSYIYKVGYHTYEESNYEYLASDEQFTKQELSALIEASAIEVVNRKKNGGDSVNTYQYIHHDVVDYLINNYGFKQLQLQAVWNCFGWSSIFKEDGWAKQGDNTEENEGLIKILNLAGFTETINPTSENDEDEAEAYYDNQNPFTIDDIEVSEGDETVNDQ